MNFAGDDLSAGETGFVKLVDDGSTTCSSAAAGGGTTLTDEISSGGADTTCYASPADASCDSVPENWPHGDVVNYCVWPKAQTFNNAVKDAFVALLASEGQCDALFGDGNGTDDLFEVVESLDHDPSPSPDAVFVRRACYSPRLVALILTEQFDATGNGPRQILDFATFFIYGCVSGGIVFADCQLTGTISQPGLYGVFLNVSSDSDRDGIDDGVDNCPSLSNPGQENHDGDEIDTSPPRGTDDRTRARSDTSGDACDEDDDNDGLPDLQELTGESCAGAATDSLLADSDGDLFLDGAECALGADPLSYLEVPQRPECGATADRDGDNIVLQLEWCFYGTDDNLPDSDLDACADGREIASVNGDRKVSAIDLSLIAQAFDTDGYPLPASIADADFDLNKDRKISSIDLYVAAVNFGDC